MESGLAEQRALIDAPTRTDYRPTFDHRVSSPAIATPIARADADVLAAAYAKSAAAIAAGIATSEAAAASEAATASASSVASPVPVSTAAYTPTSTYEAPAVVSPPHPKFRKYQNQVTDAANRHGVFFPYDIDPEVTMIPPVFAR